MSDLARPLAEAAQRLFAQRCATAVVGAAEAGEWPQALWQHIEELAPAQLLVPEDRGGAGGDWFDACALAEVAGEFNVPLPLPESVLAGWLLDHADAPPPKGPVGLALTSTNLASAAAAGHVTVDERAVPWGAAAAGVVLVGPGEGDEAWLLFLPRRTYAAKPGRAPAGDPRDHITCHKLVLAQAGIRCHRLPGLRAADVKGRAALLRAAQIAGACRRILDLSLAYTSERVQFGRTIGQFQSVQHQLAQLAEEVSAARVAVRAAAQTPDGPWAIPALAAAKMRAGEAAGLGARIAHQLHGAIGVTAEHPLHQSTRRLLAWRDEHGAEAWWSRTLVQALRDAGAPGAWQAVVAATSR